MIDFDSRYELDRQILDEEGWGDLAAKGFDAPRQFAAFLHTLQWNCITATDPNLFQAPFRAGIKIDAYDGLMALRPGTTTGWKTANQSGPSPAAFMCCCIPFRTF